MGLRIKKGDTVLVISGNYRPREGNSVQGKVLAVFPKKGKALVEGVNMAKKHTRARSQNEPGGIVERESPIRLSKLMLIDPKTGKPSRFSNAVDKDGNKTRKMLKSGNEV
ncbi:50S ribosomal protein L24 [Candidatus Sumerlaeota bacterium]|nr:50S ribosomal protein L24 [Candidatus Sumerlaeota bacterium]MBI3735141.1 50S ribosomal protein L24 [Candidatus Sumerlaeota bacterium]